MAFDLSLLSFISACQVLPDKYDKIHKKPDRSAVGMPWSNEHSFLQRILSGSFHDVNGQGCCYGFLDIRKYSNCILPLLSCHTPCNGTRPVDSDVISAQLSDGNIDHHFHDTTHQEKHGRHERILKRYPAQPEKSSF
jgi:hypothetical protein